MKKIVCGIAMLGLLGVAANASLIISEVVDGTLPFGQPKWAELTNTGGSPVNLAGYSFGNFNNGSVLPGGGETTVLSGSLAAGASYVISYEADPGAGTSTFENVYGWVPDLFMGGGYINGDDALALFIADGSGTGGASTSAVDATVVDVYGVIGVDGTGSNWEYLDSYSYRLATSITGDDPWVAANWFVAGANALEGADDAEELQNLLDLTTPGSHVFIPEPSTLALLGLSSLLLIHRRRRR